MLKKISSFLLAIFLISCAGLTPINKPAVKPALKIRNLRDFQPGLEKKLSGCSGEVYIIVHPSYYIFFHERHSKILSSKTANVVQAFLDKDYTNGSPRNRLMREYERAEMNFLSSAGEKGKIAILILPGNYRNSGTYLYKNGPDEYARYLNESVKNSDLVFYIESRNANTGKLAKDEQKVLLDFLKYINATEIYIGGGYVGRCQREFFKFLAKHRAESELAIVPELSAFSPDDISDSTAKMLLTPDMKFNTPAANYFIKNGILKGMNVNLKNISPDNNNQNSSE